jgi:hypothetical protein
MKHYIYQYPIYLFPELIEVLDYTVGTHYILSDADHREAGSARFLVALPGR